MTRTGLSRIGVAGLVIATLAIVLSACGGTTIAPPKGAQDNLSGQTAGAVGVLAALQRGLARHDRGAVLRMAAPDPASRAAVAAIFNNAQRLGMRAVTLRYLGEDDGDTPARLVRRYGPKAWAAAVSSSWRLPYYDQRATYQSIELDFVQTPQGVRLAGQGGVSERYVLWLSPHLQIAKTPQTLVLTSAADGPKSTASALLRQAVTAVRQVREVLHGWRGKLVIEAPATQALVEQALAVGAGEYDNIAAVTSTVDGSLAPGSPVHIFLNPQVYYRLEAKGAQVVLTHETTHVATQAQFAHLPTWLAEGFADYVALAHAGVPVDVAAAEMLRDVRRNGPPTHLPTAADFAPSAPGLQATYESAWTVCRYFAHTYGEKALVRFYFLVDHGRSVAGALRTTAGVDLPKFIQGWRSDLLGLAAGGRTSGGRAG